MRVRMGIVGLEWPSGSAMRWVLPTVELKELLIFRGLGGEVTVQLDPLRVVVGLEVGLGSVVV